AMTTRSTAKEPLTRQLVSAPAAPKRASSAGPGIVPTVWVRAFCQLAPAPPAPPAGGPPGGGGGAGPCPAACTSRRGGGAGGGAGGGGGPAASRRRAEPAFAVRSSKTSRESRPAGRPGREGNRRGPSAARPLDCPCEGSRSEHQYSIRIGINRRPRPGGRRG